MDIIMDDGGGYTHNFIHKQNKYKYVTNKSDYVDRQITAGVTFILWWTIISDWSTTDANNWYYMFK